MTLDEMMKRRRAWRESELGVEVEAERELESTEGVRGSSLLREDLWTPRYRH